ncbi:DUF4097 family beta strand repeat protein [Ornithinibacillus sp. BX22]|uniref:DUF4097 family beta strand repeat protein n=1 Tax=Ornithinibacillus hominis TaxID=2763055 RepID=A0A923L5L3_9BACI|nr:DUF4097 family beta strand repeat-containing protein [Ornithinibacillus hominis]MBC5636856.1 DUF4097 family beta strand repeat protein [Ornithinibacillus hominis]
MVTDIISRIFGGTKQKVVQEESIAIHKLSDLIISVDSAEVEVIPHESPSVDIKLESFEGGPVLETTKTDDTLLITAKRERQGIVFLWGNVTKCKLQLHIPVDIADNVDITATSGKITLTHLIANTVRIMATSGTVNLAKVTASKLTLNTTSGKIRAKELKTEKLSFVANSGIAEIHSSYGNIHGSVGSGSIRLTEAKGEELELKAGSGKLILREVYMKQATVRSNSGMIEAKSFYGETTNAHVGSGKISFRDFSGALKANAYSGNINLSVSENAGLDLKTGRGNIRVGFQEYELNSVFDIKTGSGSIVTNLPMKIEQREKHHIVGKSGYADNLIRVRTGSGNAELYTEKSSIMNQ